MDKKTTVEILVIVGLFAFIGLTFFAFTLLVRNQNELTMENKPHIDVKKTQAVDFRFTDEDGNDVMLSDFYGKPLVLCFWASNSKTSRSQLKIIRTLYPDYADEVGFIALGEADGFHDSKEALKACAEENGFTMPQYYDTYGEGERTYNASKTPVTLFIDPEGNIFRSDFRKIKEDAFREYLADMINPEQPVG